MADGIPCKNCGWQETDHGGSRGDSPVDVTFGDPTKELVGYQYSLYGQNKCPGYQCDLRQGDLCGIIASRQHEMVGHRHDGYLAECILSGVHRNGPHVVRTPEGKYIAWEDDMECGCCEPEESDRCTVFWVIDEDEISIYQNGGY